MLCAGNAQRISVVRHAFASHDAEQESLAGLVTALGEGRVAVSHEASQPERRLIVDEYARGADGHFQLQATGADLVRRVPLTLTAPGLITEHPA